MALALSLAPLVGDELQLQRRLQRRAVQMQMQLRLLVRLQLCSVRQGTYLLQVRMLQVRDGDESWGCSGSRPSTSDQPPSAGQGTSHGREAWEAGTGGEHAFPADRTCLPRLFSAGGGGTASTYLPART